MSQSWRQIWAALGLYQPPARVRPVFLEILWFESRNSIEGTMAVKIHNENAWWDWWWWWLRKEERDVCRIVLYCVSLFCVVFHCVSLFCVVSYCVVFCSIVWYCVILCCIVLYCRKEGTCVVMSTVFQPQSLHKAISLPSKSRNGNRHCCVLQSCYVLKQTWAWTLHSSKQMHQISLSFFAHDFCKRIVMTFDVWTYLDVRVKIVPGRWNGFSLHDDQYHNTQYHNTTIPNITMEWIQSAREPFQLLLSSVNA